MTADPKLEFVLTGFTHELGFRVFAFDRIDAERQETACTVRADLALVRRYGIRVQELPLLCRSLLYKSKGGTDTRSLIFTEEAMQACISERSAARTVPVKKRKPRVETIMSTPIAVVIVEAEQQQSTMTEESWQAWLLKGKLQGEATARTMKLTFGILFASLAVAGAYYAVTVR